MAAAGDTAGPVIAIHMGSTHVRIGVFRKDRVEVIADEKGDRLIPACIAFTDTGIVFGHEAKEQLTSNPKNTVSGPMRMIGQSYNQLLSYVKDSKLKVVREKDGPAIEVECNGLVQRYSAVQLTGLLLEKVTKSAATFLGRKVSGAVIAIPATVSDQEKTAITKAAESAGLTSVHLIEEPVSALIAYKLDQNAGHYLVFHCGGRSSYAAVLNAGSNGTKVVAVSCVQELNGRSFDNHLLSHWYDRFKKKNKCDMTGNEKSVARLSQAVEKAKIRLSSIEEAIIEIDCLFKGMDFSARICRSEFEEMCNDLFFSACDVVDEVLKKADVTADHIRKVLLIGGSSKIPKIRSLVEQTFGSEKFVTSDDVVADFAVIHGTIIRSGLIPRIETNTQLRETGNISMRETVEQPHYGRQTQATTSQPSVCQVKPQVSVEQKAKTTATYSKASDGPVIAIDLGTTCSCVGIWKNGVVDIIANENGKRVTPSVVAFKSDHRSGTTRLVGDEAKEYATVEPQNVIFEAKRLIGRKFDDPVVQQDIKNWPFVIVDEDSKPKIEIIAKGKKERFHAEEISAFVLSKLKSMAESYTGQMVKKAVITVPAYFDNFQRTATKEAAKIAGLEVLKIINEPTAAAIAYGLDFVGEKTRHILVYDLGGGTFDVSVLSVKDQVFEVKATAGDTHLGGADFDNRLVSYFCSRIMRENGRDLTRDSRAMARLRFACERTKIRLSESFSAVIEIDSLSHGFDFSDSITRAKFEELCDDLFKKTTKSLEKVMIDANLQSRDIDDIVMVGGSTRIPKIQQMVSAFFHGRDLKRDINPDEAVAYGAVIQSAILSDANELALISVRDVTPLSLGVSTYGGVMSVLLSRNTSIPAENMRMFCTIHDNQTHVDVQVYQGERQMVADNVKLGEFRVTGIPAAPRGVSPIPVVFTLDEDGILEVKASPYAGAHFKSIRITDPCDLPDSDIKKMVRKAKEMVSNDEDEVERAKARNDLYFACYDYRHDARIGSRCQQMLRWLEDHPHADKNTLLQKLRCIHE